MSNPQNTQGTPGENEEADTASGGAPERIDEDHDEAAGKGEGEANDERSE